MPISYFRQKSFCYCFGFSFISTQREYKLQKMPLRFHQGFLVARSRQDSLGSLEKPREKLRRENMDFSKTIPLGYLQYFLLVSHSNFFSQGNPSALGLRVSTRYHSYAKTKTKCLALLGIGRKCGWKIYKMRTLLKEHLYFLYHKKSPLF